MAAKKLIAGHWYKFNDRGEIHIGQYVGRQQGFECVVCGKGGSAYTFNLWYSENGDYETWGYGKEHMPEILEEVGGVDDIVLDTQEGAAKAGNDRKAEFRRIVQGADEAIEIFERVANEMKDAGFEYTADDAFYVLRLMKRWQENMKLLGS